MLDAAILNIEPSTHCLGFFSCGSDKIPWQKQFKGERVHFGSQFWLRSVVVGKSQLEELEGAGHIASLVKKQREANYDSVPFLHVI